MHRPLAVSILAVVLFMMVVSHAFAQPMNTPQTQTKTAVETQPEQNPPTTPTETLKADPGSTQSVQSPTAPPTTPVTPSVGYPVTPAKEELKEEKKPFYWESYEKLLEQQPYLVLVDHYGRYLFRPVVFLLMTLICLRSGWWFLGSLMGKEENEMSPKLAQTHRILRIVVWVIALAIASECVGMSWFGAVTLPLITMLSKVISAVVWFAVCLVIVSAFAFAISASGRDLVLSLLGGLWYLTYASGKPSKDDEFDIGDGLKAKIFSVDPLNTTFVDTEGAKHYRPNALVMRQHYHWELPLA